MCGPTLISVLITTYNYGQFIEEAIESVLAQDFPRDQIEILVVDDGSTDGTSERVKKYGTSINYLYKSNGGQASALNHGIIRARGEIIALLDADDLFLPGKLARIVDVFRAEPTLGMVYHRLQEWHVESDERRAREFVDVSGDIRNMPDQLLAFIPQPTSAISFRRESLKPLLPVPERIRMLADCYLVSLIPFIAPIRGVPEFLTVYRIHGRNSYANVKSQAWNMRRPMLGQDDRPTRKRLLRRTTRSRF
jgi:glycosyltransferase involved in cell wall biosynthesis